MKKGAYIFVMAMAIVTLLSSVAMAQEPLLKRGVGRIAISSDGNEHDDDDWAATPISLAILSSLGMQDQLTLYTFSDHVWGSNKVHPNSNNMSAYEQMLVSALGGMQRFGFESSKFLCAVDDPQAAYQAMADAINASSADDPLIIIGGGPMHVIGEGLRLAKKSKRKYVSVISHSKWNNNHSDNAKEGHSGWRFEEMEEAFGSADGGGVSFIQILDQNGGDDYEGLKAPKAQFDWLKESKDKSWRWLYSRLELCPKSKGAEFDCSDAGMVLYVVTGVEKTSTSLLHKILSSK